MPERRGCERGRSDRTRSSQKGGARISVPVLRGTAVPIVAASFVPRVAVWRAGLSCAGSVGGSVGQRRYQRQEGEAV